MEIPNTVFGLYLYVFVDASMNIKLPITYIVENINI